MGESQDLVEFLAEYEMRANACDFDAVRPLIDENAVYWFSNGSYRGIAEIQKAFEETWKNIREETYKISDVRWIFCTTECAVCIYHFRSDGIVEGERQVYSGRGTNVLRKKDGSWKMIHEHLSKEE